MESSSPENHPSSPAGIVSPFANTSASVAPSRKAGSKIAALIAVGLLLLGGGGFLIYQYLHDPFRTLEVFPVAKYLESYRALAGAKFKAELRVETDLGWKDGVGRLMLFSTTQDSHVIAVMIPVSLSTTYFTKGQTYLAELEVREGGLIYANSCKKN